MSEGGGAENIGQWLLAAAFVGQSLMIWIKLRGRPEQREITPQPLSVREDKPGHELYAGREHLHPQYMTREEHQRDCAAIAATQTVRDDAREKALEKFATRIENRLDAMIRDTEERTKELHGRITDLLTPIAENRSRLDEHIRQHRTPGGVVP